MRDIVQLFSVDTTRFSLQICFFGPENMKKLPSKPILFQCWQPAQTQSKSHFLFHKNVSLHVFYIMTHCIYKMLPIIFSECDWTLWYFCEILIIKLFLILNDICAQITSYKIDNSSFCQECKVRFWFWQLNQQTFVYCFKSITWFDTPNWPIIHNQS